MNKGIVGIIAVIVLALGAGVFLAGGSDDEESASATPAPTSVTNASGEEIQLESSGTQQIVDYTPEALAASETDSNLLFFHAKWCTVCESVQRNINAGSIPDSVSIFRVDYDSDEGRALADQYNIPIQYSMVQVDTNGTEVTQWVNNFNDGIEDIVANLM